MSKRFLAGACLALATAALLLAAPQGQQAAPAQKQPTVKSQAEGQSLQAVFNPALDPDARLKAGEDFLGKYADSDFRSMVLMIMAETYRQKNDYPNLVTYAERSLEADPKNYMAMLMLSSAYAQRTREFDLDKEEKLRKATDYATKAMDLVASAPKPRPDLTDEQWGQAKGAFTSQAHETLAMVALVRKDYDAAVSEFNTAIAASTPPEPSTLARLGAAYIDSGKADDKGGKRENAIKKYDQAIAALDKAINTPNVPQQVKNYAESLRAQALSLKNPAPKAQPGQPAPGAAAQPAPTPIPAPAQPAKP